MATKKITSNKTRTTPEKRVEQVAEKLETKVAKEPASKRIRMLKTYIGGFGIFHAGKEYELETKVANLFLNNGEAVLC